MKTTLTKHASLICTCIVLLLCSVVIIFLQVKTFYIDPVGSIRTYFDAYGDMPLHLTQVSKFAFQPLTDMSDPIYYGNRLQYPFIVNMLSGLLLRVTNAWSFSVLMPVVFLSLLNILLVFLVYKKIVKKNSYAILALLLFFLGTSLAFFSQAHVMDMVHSGTFMSVSVNEPPSFDAQNLNFPVPLTTALLFQRTTIIGLTFFLVFILLLFALKEKMSKSWAIMAGIVYGLMPLIHMHTFIAASIVLTVYFLMDIFSERKLWKNILLVGCCGLLLSLPQILFLVNFKNVGEGFIHFRLGWMTEPGPRSIIFDTAGQHHPFLASLYFYLLNFGLLIPLFIMALVVLLYLWKKGKKIDNPLLFCLFSSVTFFVIIQCVRFQPWDFDNNKLILYTHFFAIPVIIWLFARMETKKPWLSRALFSLFLIISLASGVADVISHLNSPREQMPVIFSKQARDLTEFIQQQHSPHDLILTSTTHINPVASLLGRPVYVGYPGWLWTRGVIYSSREQEIKHFYKNPEDRHIFEHFGATYILVGPQALNEYGASLETFQKQFTELYSNDEYHLFKNEIQTESD